MKSDESAVGKFNYCCRHNCYKDLQKKTGVRQAAQLPFVPTTNLSSFFWGGRGADLAMSKQKLTLLPCNCEVRGLCMCKETQVIPVNRVAYKKRKIVKM
jgi:hypothetical protein